LRSLRGPLALDRKGPQQACVAVGVVGNPADGVENRGRAVRRRVGGPGQNGRIVRAAVPGEGDPGRRDPRPNSWAPGAPAVVSAMSVLSKTNGRSIDSGAPLFTWIPGGPCAPAPNQRLEGTGSISPCQLSALAQAVGSRRICCLRAASCARLIASRSGPNGPRDALESMS
jgi:hypothetical protein